MSDPGVSDVRAKSVFSGFEVGAIHCRGRSRVQAPHPIGMHIKMCNLIAGMDPASVRPATVSRTGSRRITQDRPRSPLNRWVPGWTAPVEPGPRYRISSRTRMFSSMGLAPDASPPTSLAFPRGASRSASPVFSSEAFPVLSSEASPPFSRAACPAGPLSRPPMRALPHGFPRRLAR